MSHQGALSETVKFYEKELKQNARGLAETDAPISNVSKLKNVHIENFIEYQQRLGRVSSKPVAGIVVIYRNGLEDGTGFV